VRLAVVSDFHGNQVATAVALRDLQRDPVDAVVCLGDVAQGGPEPAAVVDELRALPMPVSYVLGNSDGFLLDPTATKEAVTDQHLAARDWTNEQLGSERLEFIGSFEPTVTIDLGWDRSLLAFHGSPRDYDEIILPADDEESFRSKIGPVDATFLAGGHVHRQWLRRVDAATFFCPGSVGLGYDPEQPEDDFRFDPFASYAVLTSSPGGVELAFRRVDFDYREVVAALGRSSMPRATAELWRWEPREGV
jgi:predicted phosphodiesterase